MKTSILEIKNFINTLDLTNYQVEYHSHDDMKIIDNEQFRNLEEARELFENSKTTSDEWDNLILQKITNEIEDMESLISCIIEEIVCEDDTIADLKSQIEDYIFDTKYVLECVDSNVIEEFEIKTINNSTEELITEVQSLLADKLGAGCHSKIRYSKYFSLYKKPNGDLTLESYDEKTDEDFESVNIRIADHTHNPNNGSNDLNILICNKNATFNRYHQVARTDLQYDEDNTAEGIVEEILNYFK